MDFQTRSGIATILDSVAFTQLYSSLLIQPFSGSTFPIDINPIRTQYFNLQHCFYLSLHPLLPPTSLRQGLTIHLDGSPHHWPPLLVCASLPFWADTRISARKPVTDFPFLISPTFHPSTCAQVSVIPRGSTIQWYLPPYACLLLPHVCPPPCWPGPAAQSPAGPEGFASCSFVPRPLYNRLTLPVFCAISWRLLEFNFPSGVLLR